MRIGRTIGGLVVGGAAVFAGTQATGDDTTRSDTGEIVESGGLGAFSLQIGDCIQLPDESAVEVQSVEGVPCSQLHDAQVYAEFDVPDGSFPGLSGVEDLAADGCLSRWTAAVGTDYSEDTELDVFWFTPSAQSWDQGDREVSCMIVDIDFTGLVGDRLR